MYGDDVPTSSSDNKAVWIDVQQSGSFSVFPLSLTPHIWIRAYRWNLSSTKPSSRSWFQTAAQTTTKISSQASLVHSRSLVYSVEHNILAVCTHSLVLTNTSRWTAKSLPCRTRSVPIGRQRRQCTRNTAHLLQPARCPPWSFEPRRDRHRHHAALIESYFINVLTFAPPSLAVDKVNIVNLVFFFSTELAENAP